MAHTPTVAPKDGPCCPMCCYTTLLSLHNINSVCQELIFQFLQYLYHPHSVTVTSSFHTYSGHDMTLDQLLEGYKCGYDHRQYVAYMLTYGQWT